MFGIENLLQHATEYYKSLFGKGSGDAFELDPNLWSLEERVNEQEHYDLTKPFSEEEIKNDLFLMERNKAAIPDGLPIDFFQKCWETVKEDVCELFSDLYLGQLDIKRLNYGIITLLPKIKDASKIQQFRPICLLNCIYKWFTRGFTMRLDPVTEG